jgi:lyso-ornithine lipid O-acyltransferase
LLANHRSYLDPILILGATEAFPVAKAEVRKWPVLGAGAAATGVIFLNRASAKSRGETLFAIAEQFEKGHRVILFPEGTTGAEQTTIPFKKGSFQLAAKYNLPIVPVAIKYSDKRDFWIGDESFVGHFFRTFGEKRKLVDVVFGEKIAGGNADFLMNETRNWLDGELLN